MEDTVRTTMSGDVLRRNEIEERYHDEWAKEIDASGLLVPGFFESPTAIDNQYILGQIGSLEGKRILDLGCGAGEAAVYFALKGANVSGVDISSEMLAVAERLAERHGVEVDLKKGRAEGLEFEDESFDVVYGYGVLHHIDLALSAKEIQRVLKKGGVAFFVEPMGYNPILWVYRFLAKKVRTPVEQPFFFSQLRFFKGFSSVYHKELWLFSLLAFLNFFFIKRYHPSKVRYWRQVLIEGEECKRWFRVLKRLDDVVFRFFPPSRYLSSTTVIGLRK